MNPTPTRIAAYRDKRANKYTTFSGAVSTAQSRAYSVGFDAGRDVGELESGIMAAKSMRDVLQEVMDAIKEVEDKAQAQLDELLGGKE